MQFNSYTSKGIRTILKPIIREGLTGAYRHSVNPSLENRPFQGRKTSRCAN